MGGPSQIWQLDKRDWKVSKKNKFARQSGTIGSTRAVEQMQHVPKSWFHARHILPPPRKMCLSVCPSVCLSVRRLSQKAGWT